MIRWMSFMWQQVQEDGIESSDEALCLVEDSQFDGDKAWVTGNVPKMKPVHIEGDTSIINAWFKGVIHKSICDNSLCGM
jgi:hypothetical protein